MAVYTYIKRVFASCNWSGLIPNVPKAHSLVTPSGGGWWSNHWGKVGVGAHEIKVMIRLL